MKKFSDDEFKKAFLTWYPNYEPREADKSVSPFLVGAMPAFVPQEKSWLRMARTSLFLSVADVAKKLDVSKAAYSKYEESEANGAISLATLARAAEAMDCELVYAIRPKHKKTFSEIIWSKLLGRALKHPWLQKCDQKRRAGALAGIAKQLMSESGFRKEMGWSQRANSSMNR